MSLNKKMICLIQKYQKNKAYLGAGRCKHYPTCSNYAIGCYEKFGFFSATFHTIGRIVRCNPWTKKTYDPVPLTKDEKIKEKKYLEKAKEYLPFVKIDFTNPDSSEIDDLIQEVVQRIKKEDLSSQEKEFVFFYFLSQLLCLKGITTRDQKEKLRLILKDYYESKKPDFSVPSLSTK